MLLVCFWWLIVPFLTVRASTPNVVVSINGVEKTWPAKRALFGSKEDRLEALLVHSPAYDELLCEYYNERNYTVHPVEDHEPWIMMAPRGTCTFERKAYAAKEWYKASGVLIYDNLSARYQWNNETQKLRYPLDENDYECSFGYGFVENIELDPPPYSRRDLDPILDMKSNTTNCTLEKTLTPCESQLCLVTGPAAANTSKYPVCCAWDLPMTMGGDDDTPGNTDDIMAVFLTIRQGQELVTHVGEIVVIEARPYSPWNASMLFLWTLGVLVCFLASWFSVSDFRVFRAQLASYQANIEKKKLKHANGGSAESGWDDEAPDPNDSDLDAFVMGIDDLNSDEEGNDKEREDGTPEEDIVEGDDEDETKDKFEETHVLHSLPPKGKDKEEDRGKVWVLHSLPPSQRKSKAKKMQRKGYKAEPTATTDTLPTDGGAHLPEPWATPIAGFEMTHWHVFVFLVLASVMLFLLFYFQFYSIVFVLYGFGCAGAVSHIIFGPILVRIVPKFGDEVVKEMNKNVVCGLNAFDVTSQLLGYVWAIVWIWYGMSHYRPSTNAFFWITIDVFGACFCIMALSMMKLKNIKIATMLLVAVFFYDIFFVFLTPLFMDGESVMITVAKGGNSGESTADDFCYKYPEDKDCTGIDFLPMLLVFPRFNDYLNGSSLLGLGDVVLPGFLIAFCARLDEAKRIIGKHTRKEMEYPEKWYQGYYFWLMIAYGIGLALAYIAFGTTGVGQPALLYLVPCCLGMITIVGRKDLRNLWTGPRAIRLADKLKDNCERAWGKERMRRQVAKHKRERGEGEQPQGDDTNRSIQNRSRGFRQSVRRGQGSRKSGRDAGRGRGGRPPNAGRGSDRNKMLRKSLPATSDGNSSKTRSDPNKLLRKSVPGKPMIKRVNEGQGPNENDMRFGSSNSTSSSKRDPSMLANPPHRDSSDLSSTSSPRKQRDLVAGEKSSPGRYSATLDGSSSKSKSDRKKMLRKSVPVKPKLEDNNERQGPHENEIRFGDPNCIGIKHLRTVVKRELRNNPEAEFSTSSFKSVMERLEDRDFLISDGNGGWRDATKQETKHEISKVFDTEKSKREAKSRRKEDSKLK